MEPYKTRQQLVNEHTVKAEQHEKLASRYRFLRFGSGVLALVTAGNVLKDGPDTTDIFGLAAAVTFAAGAAISSKAKNKEQEYAEIDWAVVDEHSLTTDEFERIVLNSDTEQE